MPKSSIGCRKKTSQGQIALNVFDISCEVDLFMFHGVPGPNVSGVAGTRPPMVQTYSSICLLPLDKTINTSSSDRFPFKPTKFLFMLCYFSVFAFFKQKSH